MEDCHRQHLMLLHAGSARRRQRNVSSHLPSCYGAGIGGTDGSTKQQGEVGSLQRGHSNALHQGPLRQQLHSITCLARRVHTQGPNVLLLHQWGSCSCRRSCGAVDAGSGMLCSGKETRGTAAGCTTICGSE